MRKKEVNGGKPKIFKFTIRGNPVAWKRPGQSRWGRYDTQKSLKDALGSIFKVGLTNHPPLLGKIKLIAVFFMPIPKSLPTKDREGWHTKRPDLDNLVKLMMDAMNGIVFKDDSQVCAIIAMKGYGEIPRTELTIMEDFNDEADAEDGHEGHGEEPGAGRDRDAFSTSGFPTSGFPTSGVA